MSTDALTRYEDAITKENDKRQLALLKAVGLDRAAPEQRELAIAIAKRYDLDLLLKHMILIEGRPYLTRDGLLHIAHRSGHFDGIAVTKPVVEDKHWYAEATVWRNDMGHPFVYGGRYPTSGGNQKFAPEMAVKVAESMALRRAFNIAAPSADERWDVDVPAEPATPPPSLRERAAARRSEVEGTTDAGELHPPAEAATEPAPSQAEVVIEEPPVPAEPAPPAAADVPPAAPVSSMHQCDSIGGMDGNTQCRREAGHKGPHKTAKESWE